MKNADELLDLLSALPDEIRDFPELSVGDKVQINEHAPQIRMKGVSDIIKTGTVVAVRRNPHFIRVIRDGAAKPDPIEYAMYCWKPST